jgi:SsrA-binding protein
MMSLLENKKARFDFEILEDYEAGIELLGFEVKSLREKRGNLSGSHVTIRGGEAYLLNANIPPYQPKNSPKDYDPERMRRLLLSKKEIQELAEKEGQKGLTIVPLSVYNKGRLIKIKIGVARGKKKHDKRETLRKKQALREIKRDLKHL